MTEHRINEFLSVKEVRTQSGKLSSLQIINRWIYPEELLKIAEVLCSIPEVNSVLSIYKKPRVGICAVIINRASSSLLLGKRKKEPDIGKYVFPGGGIEEFEPMSVALDREVFEETGLIISQETLLTVKELIETPKNIHRILVFKLATYVSGEIVCNSDLEGAEFFTKNGIEYLYKENKLGSICCEILRSIGWL